MDKVNILEKYKKEEKILVAKFLDKIEMTKKNNNVTCTNFLDMHQKKIIKDIIKILYQKQELIDIKIDFYGGWSEAERVKCFIYPDFINQYIYSNDIAVVEIILPKILQGTYEHRNYLGALMKLGLKREKIGDILVNNQGADIIVDCDIAEFVKENLLNLTRFSKAKIRIKDLKELIIVESQKKEIDITIQSLRLDLFVSELIHTSRSKVKELIDLGKVFINQEVEYKYDKNLKKGDIITIRGKGKFIFSDIIGVTKKSRSIVKVLKYI